MARVVCIAAGLCSKETHSTLPCCVTAYCDADRPRVCHTCDRGIRGRRTGCSSDCTTEEPSLVILCGAMATLVAQACTPDRQKGTESHMGCKSTLQLGRQNGV